VAMNTRFSGHEFFEILFITISFAYFGVYKT